MGRDVPSGRILRFRLSERLLHWAIALPFLVCFSTALVLVLYYNPVPTRPHRALVSLVHRVSGLCLIGLPLLVLLGGIRDRRTHWENIKEGWIWSFSDVKWLLLMPFAMLCKRVRLPEEGKFNAGEKLNFMWVMASWPLYGLTGALIWLGNDAERLIGMPLRLGVLPWIAHFALAAISTLLVSGHLFMALVNPASRIGLSGMFSGRVSRHWASHHYRRWFKERFAPAPFAAPEPPPAAPPAPAAEPDEWERDTDVDAEPWLGFAPEPVDPRAPAYELGDLSLLEMMRSGAHTVAVETIDHVKTGAYVAARPGVALTPAVVVLAVILAGGLAAAGVLVTHVGLPPGSRPRPPVRTLTMAPATAPAATADAGAWPGARRR